jgi:hypothetical protein
MSPHRVGRSEREMDVTKWQQTKTQKQYEGRARTLASEFRIVSMETHQAATLKRDVVTAEVANGR